MPDDVGLRLGVRPAGGTRGAAEGRTPSPTKKMSDDDGVVVSRPRVHRSSAMDSGCSRCHETEVYASRLKARNIEYARRLEKLTNRIDQLQFEATKLHSTEEVNALQKKLDDAHVAVGMHYNNEQQLKRLNMRIILDKTNEAAEGRQICMSVKKKLDETLIELECYKTAHDVLHMKCEQYEQAMESEKKKQMEYEEILKRTNFYDAIGQRPAAPAERQAEVEQLPAEPAAALQINGPIPL